MKVEELNIGVKINCDIANPSEQDYNDINELYLKHLIIVFENQSYQTLVICKTNIPKWDSLQIMNKCYGNKMVTIQVKENNLI